MAKKTKDTDPAAPTRDELLALLESGDRATRWRLILGKAADEDLAGGAGGLSTGLVRLDDALDLVYADAQRSAGLGKSSPRLARWLGDIRRYFDKEVVAVIQQDAIERRGLKQLLFEPETLGQVVPSVELAATLLTFSRMIPDEAKETAREVVRAVAEDITRRLRTRLERSLKGALDRTRHAPQRRLANLDVRRTIRRNLKNYDAGRKALIVEREYFWARRHREAEWNVIVCLDTSGSMAASVVYGAIVASILASIRALSTHLVLFDTEVVDASEQCHDPVEVLFGFQLGGGTDIDRAVAYCQGLVREPRKTLFALVTDLCEGGNAESLVQRLGQMVQSGVRAVCLLALNDDGAPSFDGAMARKVRDLGMPAFACTPNRLADLLEAAIRGDDLGKYAPAEDGLSGRRSPGVK